MADVKVSALTALTGADLANGDQFLVTDVGSPNVSKSITADQLAQGSQFSSRYVAKSGETIWIGEGEFSPLFGSPVIGSYLIPGIIWWPAAVMGGTANSAIGATKFIPSYWQTMDVDIYYTKVGSGSGNVQFNFSYKCVADAEDASSGDGGNTSVAAPAQFVTDVARIAGPYTVDGGQVALLHLQRSAEAAGDTLTDDIAVYGMLLTRAS